jgi:hypothetical protein
MPYNGKPTSKELPEFDFENLPDKLPQKRGRKQPNTPEQTYANPPKSMQEVPNSIQPATGADGNRSADLFTKDRQFDFQQHDWQQFGRELVCKTCPDNHAHAAMIPADKMLTGSRGNWQIVPIGGRCRAHGKIKMLCEECADLTVNSHTPKE